MSGQISTYLIINLLVRVVGFSILVQAVRKYHKLLRTLKQSTYLTLTRTYNQKLTLALLIIYAFGVGYIYSAVNLIFFNKAAADITISLLYVIGSIFITCIIDVLANMERLLRDKTIDVMKAFVTSVELKDPYTKGHSEHVYRIVKLFYNYLDENVKKQLNFPKLLDAAMLHDIGKICVRDEILNKKGRLEQDEWLQIKKHAAEGKRMLDQTCYRDVSDWVLYHHERIDGKGYFELVGEEIPLESRIISIADVYSALSTDRVYRIGFSHEDAIAELKRVAGQQLDEELLESFFTIPAEELKQLLLEVKKHL